MDALICNKCFVPIYRGKHPYNITQCAHIFCQDCLQQAEKECPQCRCVGVMSMPLKEPLLPKVAPYFVPFAETLELLLKVDMFRSNQMKIVMQRFRELDKKYEMLKNQYWLMRRDMKILTEKYMNLKSEIKNLDKKLLISQMQQRRTPRPIPNMTKTPLDSGIFVHPSSTGYSSESMEYQKAKVTPIQSDALRKQYKSKFDNFLISGNHKQPNPSSNMSLDHSFMR